MTNNPTSCNHSFTIVVSVKKMRKRCAHCPFVKYYDEESWERSMKNANTPNPKKVFTPIAKHRPGVSGALGIPSRTLTHRTDAVAGA